MGILDDIAVLINPDSTDPVQKIIQPTQTVGPWVFNAEVPAGRAWDLIAVGCSFTNSSASNNAILFTQATTSNGEVLFTSPLSPAIPIGASGEGSWAQDIFPLTTTDDQNDYIALASLPTGLILPATATVQLLGQGADNTTFSIVSPIIVVNEFTVDGSDTPPVMSAALRAWTHDVATAIASALA